ncbi:MAG TPA: pyridoxamine 5'-phosphate oxidase family protein [Dermatophilaceae bacterium]|nr:pyridoxamine 5'-phosphate oxidase family protein [Dermatophilaceae bacterium]
MADPDATAKVIDIMRGSRFCMVTVADAEGELLARPMTPQEVTDGGDVWFFVDRTSDQAVQVATHEHVNLSFSDGSTWLSVAGRGAVVLDRARMDELWSSVVEAWFPNGKDDPEVALLHVAGDSAEYWDSPGGRVASALSFAKAKVTGQSLDAENETVELP